MTRTTGLPSTPSTVIEPEFHDLEHTPEDFQLAVLTGLGAVPKTLPAKYFYDARGSELFDQICALPEYYPTRTEIGLLERHAVDIAAAVGPDATIIEFGAGSVVKIRLLLEAAKPHVFIALDISREHLLQSARLLAKDYPHTRMIAMCADFTQPLSLPTGIPDAGRVAFFPGSTIGNFAPGQARAFLARVHTLLGPGGGFLIGVDLVKDEDRLVAAYDDSQGVTAAFNLNQLQRINRDLGADFDLSAFRHLALWNSEDSRIEMHLQSTCGQTVSVAGRAIRFQAHETIHTENSYKYTVDGFQKLARRAGYQPEHVWVDEEHLFSVHFLRG